MCDLTVCLRDVSLDRKAEDGSCYFGGWARMAHPLVAFSVVEVSHVWIITSYHVLPHVAFVMKHVS